MHTTNNIGDASKLCLSNRKEEFLKEKEKLKLNKEPFPHGPRT